MTTPSPATWRCSHCANDSLLGPAPEGIGQILLICPRCISAHAYHPGVSLPSAMSDAAVRTLPVQVANFVSALQQRYATNQLYALLRVARPLRHRN